MATLSVGRADCRAVRNEMGAEARPGPVRYTHMAAEGGEVHFHAPGSMGSNT